MKTNVAIPPRMLLKDELSAQGMSQRQLATIHGIAGQHHERSYVRQKPLTARTAVELERALAIPAHLWVHLEANYRLALERGHSSVSTRDYLIGEEQ